MTVRKIVLGLLALVAVACSNEVTRTQLTFRINAGASVLASIDQLRVTVRSSSSGDQTQRFDAAQLSWPVEIVVLPQAGNRSTDSVTLIVSAFSGGAMIAEQTSSASFRPERIAVVDMALGSDAVLPKDAGSATQPDAGSTPRDSGPAVVPDAGTDEPPPPDNCETNSKDYVCDDDNPCNGVETCNPASRDADARGCVPSDSPVTCAKDMTCDSATGECSTCLAKPDGDGDGFDSIACGGMDCNDNAKDVAPGKPEKCNNRDDDCDGTRDGPAADADCASSAPRGGTASCLSGGCVGACDDKTYQIANGVCVPVPAACPTVNPCAPGSCNAGTPTYTCTCPDGYRAGVGMTRCAPIGVPKRTIGFESTCDGMPTPGTFTGELKPIASDLYASCGVNAINSGTLMSTVQLIKPQTTVIEGISQTTALEVPFGMSTPTLLANSELTIGFSQLVAELSFDILDIDNLPGLKVTLRAGNAVIPNVVIAPPATGSKRTRFTYLAPTAPVDLVYITYTPLDATDALYIDALSYRVGGCGDEVMEGSETCDDGNAVQCDGCDNACGASSAGCYASGTCYAGGAMTADGCRVCDLATAPGASGDVPLSKSPTAPAGCAN